VPKDISPEINNLRKQVDELERLSDRPDRLESVLLEASTSLLAILESLNYQQTNKISTKYKTSDFADASDNLLEVLSHSKERLVESEARSRELSALHRATVALLTTLDPEALLGRILDAALSAIPAANKGMIHLIAQDNDPPYSPRYGTA
jgi:hypothetical protein